MQKSLEKFESLDRDIKVFLAGEALLALGMGIALLLLNLHLLGIGVGKGTIGLLVAVEAAAIALVAIPFGSLAGRLGRRYCLAGGTVLYGVSLFLATSSDLIVLFAGRILGGIGLGAMMTSEFAVVLHYCRTRRTETTVFSMVMASFTLFMGIGNLLGGFLPRWLGADLAGVLSPAPTPYQYLIWIGGIVCMAAGASRLLLRWAPTLRREIPRKSERVGEKILIFGGAAGLSGAMYGILGPFLNVVARIRFEAPTDAIGIMFTVASFALAAGSVLSPKIVERFDEAKGVLALGGVSSLLALLMWWAPSFGPFAVLFWLRSLVNVMGLNLVEGGMHSAVADGQRALFAGYRTVGYQAGVMVAGKAAGLIMAAGNMGFLFPILALLALLVPVYFVFIVRPQTDLV
ncbi:MAG: MFS transporter [Thermaerobacterales bacterium]